MKKELTEKDYCLDEINVALSIIEEGHLSQKKINMLKGWIRKKKLELKELGYKGEVRRKKRKFK